MDIDLCKNWFMENEEHGIISVKEWIWTILLSLLPIVNLIMLCIWGLGSKAHPVKRNFARAALVWAIVSLVFTGLGSGLKQFAYNAGW